MVLPDAVDSFRAYVIYAIFISIFTHFTCNVRFFMCNCYKTTGVKTFLTLEKKIDKTHSGIQFIRP